VSLPADLHALAETDDEGRVRVLAPRPGLWVDAPDEGDWLGPGARCGHLVVLGAWHRLFLPTEARGRVATPPPEARRAPVGHGDTLFVLEPLAEDLAAAPEETAAARLEVRAPQAGRFWRRPAPGEPPFVAEGDLLEAARTLGLLEVMKTFQPVRYEVAGGLPPSARLLRWLVTDGEEVAEGQPLAELAEE